MDDIKLLTKKVSEFGEKRDWQKYHSPKNLAMALNVEAAELLEIFQWLTEEESLQMTQENHQKAAYELADIFMYALLISERLNIDLAAVTKEKMLINEQRFPIDRKS